MRTWGSSSRSIDCAAWRRRDSLKDGVGSSPVARTQYPGGSRPSSRAVRLPCKVKHRWCDPSIASRRRRPDSPPMASHEPYIPATHFPAELTPRALILGVLLGLIFSASSVYLALKIGLTVSSSIPIAVLSITIFRALGRTSILENNIVQTTGSASDSVAAGVFYTIPALLGVGYSIGPRIAGYLFAGGCLAYLVLAPAIKLVGSGLTEPFGFPAVKLIRDMSPSEIRASFVFYIGAGAVASAGIIALARSLPTILSSFASSLKDLRDSRMGQAVSRLRTEDDLPISLTVGGSIALAIVLT